MTTTLVTQALILAGGQATRMRPYTDDAPKAMVPVAGAPIVGYQLAWLAEHGVKSVTISGGYKHEMISDYVGDGSRFGVEVRYAIEDEPLGRGGGLKFAAGRLAAPGAPFFVLNGDVITTFSLTDLSEYHQRRGGAVTVALSPYRSNWGVADLDDGDRIRGFVQSPELPYWINAGIYVFNPDVVELLPDKGDHEDSTFPELASDGRLIGYRLSGYWRGIDTVKDVVEASREIRVSGGLLHREFRTTDPNI
ncbi:nucleotidyltransferase family protein [Streptomyces katsurahamanus]|uniref:Nucleotidyltransferase family protein n=1 Tax=Streptomyces katsurahamanus TaxID=2577098 RepID=A0ABW9NV49_9ACTN|nr:nucleotidyltransferase family protein [Streptomyces katsurahamanus]MQS36759.1 nucleotidyltransferase family protein [Streptomyces katsurahamanus]